MRKVWVVLGLLLALIGGMLVLAQSTNNANIVIPESVFVRVAPSKSAVPIGTLRAGDSVRPVNLSEDGTWVLIVYRRGFGWVQRGLVAWADERALEALPVLPENATPTAEASPSSTLVPPTYTPVGHYLALENAAKAFVRSGPSQSYARLGELPNGATVEPVGRNADTTWILIRFQDAPSGFGWIGRWLVRWQDANALQTLPVLLETALTPSPTFTPVTPSATPSRTHTPTNTATATDVPTSTATKQSEIMLPATAVPTPVVSADDDGTGGGIRPETVLAIVVVLVLAAYVVLYLLLAMNAAKPAPAFLSKPCPVCQRGTLYLETKTEQVLGLPVVRRTVRCNTCRSLLRQTRRGRWRYAVDRLENPTLYARYNARELSDTQLLTLGREASRAVRPEFIEEDKV